MSLPVVQHKSCTDNDAHRTKRGMKDPRARASGESLPSDREMARGTEGIDAESWPFSLTSLAIIGLHPYVRYA